MKNKFFSWRHFYEKHFGIIKEYPSSCLDGPIKGFIPIIISRDLTLDMVIKKYKEVGVNVLFSEEQLNSLKNCRENSCDYIIITGEYPIYRRQMGRDNVNPVSEDEGLTFIEGLILFLYHREMGVELNAFVLQASFCLDSRDKKLFPYFYKSGRESFLIPIGYEQVRNMADPAYLIGIVREEIIDVEQEQAERVLVA